MYYTGITILQLLSVICIFIDASAGGSDDWAYSLGVPFSYTLELRDLGQSGFALPEPQIIPTCEETFNALKVMVLHDLVT